VHKTSLAIVLAATLSVAGCGLLNASGGAATRWAAIDKGRLEKTSGAASADAGRICKNMKATGSNVPQRVCSTQAEWDAADAQNRADAEDLTREMRSGSSTFGRTGQR
jgi:hypothetical protein